jgi:CheY-like chemotaxis protein
MSFTALVVDDSMLIRHTVCRFLEGRGFRVESASDGAEALQMLLTVRPDLIVTDVEMPKMDGFELIDAIQSRPDTAGIPIVILSRKRFHPELKSDAVHCVIYKDIDITAELAKALDEIFPAVATS